MTILLVHGDQIKLQNLQQHVQTCYPDSRILAFSDRNEALTCIEQNADTIDRCFTAVKVKCASGMKIVKKLREANSKSKNVLISETNEYAMDAWQLGVCDYLLEPVTLESVQHTLKSCGK